MAIYRSSFNQKPEKQEKPKKVKPEKPKREPKKIKVNYNAVWIGIFSLLFLVCCLPSNFVKNFLLGIIGLSVYPLLIVGVVLFVLRIKKLSLTKKPNILCILLLRLSLLGLSSI